MVEKLLYAKWNHSLTSVDYRRLLIVVFLHASLEWSLCFVCVSYPPCSSLNPVHCTRRLFHWFSYTLFVYNALLGLLAALLRVLITMLFTSALMVRLDRVVLMKGFESWDIGKLLLLLCHIIGDRPTAKNVLCNGYMYDIDRNKLCRPQDLYGLSLSGVCLQQPCCECLHQAAVRPYHYAQAEAIGFPTAIC